MGDGNQVTCAGPGTAVQTRRTPTRPPTARTPGPKARPGSQTVPTRSRPPSTGRWPGRQPARRVGGTSARSPARRRRWRCEWPSPRRSTPPPVRNEKEESRCRSRPRRLVEREGGAERSPPEVGRAFAGPAPPTGALDRGRGAARGRVRLGVRRGVGARLARRAGARRGPVRSRRARGATGRPSGREGHTDRWSRSRARGERGERCRPAGRGGPGGGDVAHPGGRRHTIRVRERRRGGGGAEGGCVSAVARSRRPGGRRPCRGQLVVGYGVRFPGRAARYGRWCFRSMRRRRGRARMPSCPCRSIRPTRTRWLRSRRRDEIALVELPSGSGS